MNDRWQVSRWLQSSSCSGGSCVQAGWARSTACTNQTCVEVAYVKSTASSAECVEAGPCRCGHVMVRDSKNVDQAPLQVTVQAWAEFLNGVAAGDFPA